MSRNDGGEEAKLALIGAEVGNHDVCRYLLLGRSKGVGVVEDQGVDEGKIEPGQ